MIANTKGRRCRLNKIKMKVRDALISNCCSDFVCWLIFSFSDTVSSAHVRVSAVKVQTAGVEMFRGMHRGMRFSKYFQDHLTLFLFFSFFFFFNPGPKHCWYQPVRSETAFLKWCLHTRTMLPVFVVVFWLLLLFFFGGRGFERRRC